MFDRRSFVKAGSIAAFRWITLGDVLAARAAAGTGGRDDLSVIHIFLSGGLSQIDSFDPKPDNKRENRSKFSSIPTSIPGVHFTEYLPRLAKLANQFTIIRSATHKTPVHVPASGLILSGHLPLSSITHPAAGSVVSKELGPRNGMPAYCSIPGAPGYWESAGYLEPKYNPFDAGDPNAADFKVRDLELPMGVDWARMERRRSLLALADAKFRKYDSMKLVDNMNSYDQMAFSMMQSTRAKRAFQIGEEPEKLRDRYGRTALGQGSLLARRLVEAGVRYVTVSRAFNSWDHHANIYPQLAESFLPELDQAFATLLEDLGSRGLLKTTLVLVTGEFGRTPEVNTMAGRDHWANVFSLCLAGAGVPEGQVYGESDREGAYVKDKPVEIPELMATLYDKLGIDYTKEHVDPLGRPGKLADGGVRPLRFLYS